MRPNVSVWRGQVAVGAERRIARPPVEVFDLLADLRRHWPLLGRELVYARMVDGAGGDGASLVLRMPLLGLRRRVVTQVVRAEAPELLEGRADAGASSVRISWLVAADGGAAAGSLVRFNAVIEPGNLRDHAMAAAARPWLRRRAALVLERLAAELADDDAKPGDSASAPLGEHATATAAATGDSAPWDRVP